MLNDPSSENETMLGRQIAIPDQKYDGITVRLAFSMEPNREVPAMIGDLLRKSYLRRMASAGRCEQ